MTPTSPLFGHQVDGARWLAERDDQRGIIGDTPGLGKTRTVISALQWQGARRPLIVAPAIVRTHWLREIELLGGFEGGRIVVSYDAIVRGDLKLMIELLLKYQCDALVLDEAHYLKHGTSARTKILLGKDGYARRLERVILASGTVMPKHPGELWTLLSSVFPDVLRRHRITTREQWNATFVRYGKGRMVRGTWMEKPIGVLNVERLQAILGEVMLRRTLDDVGLDVPRLWFQVERVDGGQLLDAIDPTTARELGHRIAEGASLEDLFTDSHVARYRRKVGEAKAPAVVEMVRSQLADSDEKLVLFAYHRSVLETLRTSLESFGVAYIDGDTSDAKRTAEMDRFQTDPRCRVFVGQNDACKTGVTLTAARRALLVEPSWTAIDNVQMGYRVARIGSTADHCIAQMVALADTLDEAIVAQHHRETEMQAAVFSSTGTPGTTHRSPAGASGQERAG